MMVYRTSSGVSLKVLGSAPFSWPDMHDWYNVLISFLLALGAFFANYFIQVIPTLDFGAWQQIVVALSISLLTLLYKFCTNTQQTVPLDPSQLKKAA